MLYRPALHGNWNALSLARRALKDKFPTPTVPFTAVLPNRQVFLPDPVSVNPQYRTNFYVPFWHLEFWSFAFLFCLLENLCTPALHPFRLWFWGKGTGFKNCITFWRW
jgi:hypothetical protein